MTRNNGLLIALPSAVPKMHRYSVRMSRAHGKKCCEKENVNDNNNNNKNYVWCDDQLLFFLKQ